MPLNILMLGDVVGRAGRQAAAALVPKLRREHNLDFVVANVENIAGGSGLTPQTVKDLFAAGVDVMTSGDHAFRKKEGEALFVSDKRVLRPANFVSQVPGKGSGLFEIRDGIRIGVINLLGRVFLKTVECPFKALESELEALRSMTPVILVDFHAEATAEKGALGRFADGRASVVAGSHTHVQTADETVFPMGTAFISDMGMCGAMESVIGRRIEDTIRLFRTQMPVRLRVAEEVPAVCGILAQVDPVSGKALGIERICEKAEIHDLV